MEFHEVLLALLIMETLGMCIFKRFETETPVWRSLLKWGLIIGGTIGLYFAVGGGGLLFPLGMMVLGSTVHVVICRREGFHPVLATPRREYYAYRGWNWPPE